MRVTNLMITRGMLGNIMTNKADMNKKYEQYATKQKIQNPSDDPVVAIRALKYRSNLSELEQYRTKNVEDAASWMDATESAMDILIAAQQACEEAYLQEDAPHVFILESESDNAKQE